MFMRGRQPMRALTMLDGRARTDSIVIELLTDEAPVNRRRRSARFQSPGRCLPPRNLRHPQTVETGAFDEGRVEEGSGASQRDMTADAHVTLEFYACRSDLAGVLPLTHDQRW